MARFGRTSRSRLRTCHSDLQAIFQEVVIEFDCSVVCGHRDKKEQNKAFHDNKSSIVWPMSKHNRRPSTAVDAAPWFSGGIGIPWEDIPQICFFAGQVLQIAKRLHAEGKIEHVLRWGGDWNSNNLIRDQNLMDYVHFELIKP